MRLLLSSPVGLLLAEYGEAGVRGLRFWRQGEHPPADTRDAPAFGDRLGARIRDELREYFAGERTEFTLPLAAEGTEFQRAVWEALRRIPCGETRSYGEVAREVGRPGGSRAVGQANAANPVAIVVPCHRVVGVSGTLTGYIGMEAGDGVAIKRWLLDHETFHTVGGLRG
jgi:methylated-DNA-[protein]-cysteine S-methyltransferase